MQYAKVLRLPQYFRNLQRLSELTTVLIKHGFGDLIQRIELHRYLDTSLKLIRPSFGLTPKPTLDFATRVRLVCEELGPTFIKFAQLVATRPDIFPTAITTELRKLQDEVPPFTSSEAREIVAAAIDMPIEKAFSDFESIPIAAASIAQVHEATLLDGTHVAVKVQRPHLARIVDVDLNILRGIAELIEENIPEATAFEPVQLVEEFARSLRFEMDFCREAQSMRRFAANFADEPDLVIPTVYESLSSSTVLVQSFIDGIKADDLPSLRAHHIDGACAVAILNRVVLRSIFEFRFFHADPHPGNIFITPDNKVALIDFGAVGRIDPTRLRQVTQLLAALLGRDLNRLVRLLQEFQMAPSALDEISFKNQISEILDTYLEETLGRLDIARMLGEAFEVSRRFGIRPPPDMLLVGKSIASLEFVGALLDPDFSPLQRIRPYLLERYQALVLDPKTYLRSVGEITESYTRLLSEAPADIRSTLRKLARDTFTLHLSSKNLPEIFAHQNKLLNRLLMCIMSISFLSLGMLTLGTASSGWQSSASITFIATGLAVLFLLWLSVRRSGGT